MCENAHQKTFFLSKTLVDWSSIEKELVYKRGEKEM